MNTEWAHITDVSSTHWLCNALQCLHLWRLKHNYMIHDIEAIYTTIRLLIGEFPAINRIGKMIWVTIDVCSTCYSCSNLEDVILIPCWFRLRSWHLLSGRKIMFPSTCLSSILPSKVMDLFTYCIMSFCQIENCPLHQRTQLGRCCGRQKRS